MLFTREEAEASTREAICLQLIHEGDMLVDPGAMQWRPAILVASPAPVTLCPFGAGPFLAVV